MFKHTNMKYPSTYVGRSVLTYAETREDVNRILRYCPSFLQRLDNEGRTAAFLVRANALNSLVEHGIDMRVRDNNGLNALEFVRTCAQQQLESTGGVDQDTQQRLVYLHRIFCSVQDITALSGDDEYGRSLLFYAIDTNVVRELLLNHADVFKTDMYGMSCLDFCAKAMPWNNTKLAYMRNVAGMYSLSSLRKVSCVLDLDSNGRSFLFHVQDVPTLEWLVNEKHLDVHLQDNGGFDALAYCMKHTPFNADKIAFLHACKQKYLKSELEKLSTLHSHDAHGRTALYYTHDPETLVWLIEEMRVFVYCVDVTALTALQYAKRYTPSNKYKIALLEEAEAKGGEDAPDEIYFMDDDPLSLEKALAELDQMHFCFTT